MINFLKAYIKRWFTFNLIETMEPILERYYNKRTQYLEKLHLEELQYQYGLVSKLSGNQCLIKTCFGHYLVVPSYNLDVAIGGMRDGMIEPWTTAVVSSILKPGDKYINVGANFGYYSVLGASLVQNSGKVYAIEANPEAFVYLVLSCYWSGYINIIESYNFAAYHKNNEPINITFNPQYLGGAGIFPPGSKNVRASTEECLWTGLNIQENLNAERKFSPEIIFKFNSFIVPGYTLDHILSDVEDVKLLHMDVEGSESFVIGGAKNLIRRSPRINLIIEWDPKHNYDTQRKPFVDDMWTFLLEEMQLTPYRIEPENYSEIGQLPNLSELNKESLFNIPHSDILLKKT
ncbi:MAG: FkbM family methyltransferase [Gammaproteobacteria bacterium]